MAVSYLDFNSPNVQYFYDLKNNRTFTKDANNFINALGIQQLNTLGNVSLLDIYLSKANVIEPHIHQNASELVYCIRGAAVVSILNPFTKTVLNYNITPGQVTNIPQGWFHWEMATEDDTHLLAIFDAPVPEFIAVSDFLRLAPRNMLAHTYCLDQALVTQALAPIKSTTTIGPPANCVNQHLPRTDSYPPQVEQHMQVNYPVYGARKSSYPGIGNGYNQQG
ncbi:quercetin dioxygenase-like cupin family protein [Paenibacillus endophyticus]|uniref:Quercetin dioxygenase-like cupin family protein n=1 Tax=Paenibacillus endophyticus TaxID=1294268 RepID=A0A7W5CEN2_9BACL|nr:cupin domain-containing protein [Paenibacillus endophyticus]MBB3156306.1 quercetin dioxygenase-like cupin family protein [Paenibacillus endophyticus]